MRYFKTGVVLVITGALSMAAVGATTEPSTRPAMEAVIPDAQETASPKAAALAYAQAMLQGDVEAAMGWVTAEREPTRQSVRLMVQMIGSQKRLSDAAVKQFGAEAGHRISPLNAQYEQSLKQIEEAQVEINGESATLSIGSEKESLPLRRVAGAWKVDLDAMPDTANLTGMSDVIQAMVAAANQTADEITAGKFKTVDEAREALDRAMMQAMLTKPAASQPSAAQPPADAP